MSTPAAAPHGRRSLPGSRTNLAERQIADFWWMWLVVGSAWVVAALVILQFDDASVTTIGIILGFMFTFAGVQQLALTLIVDSLRWMWALFGVFFLGAGMYCFFNPEKTFVGLADALGFLFLLVGVWWTIRAFLEKTVSPLWWVGLIAGILMIVLAFWTSGQFFIEKAYTLLILAGIWALMQGVTDIMRAFQVRSLKSEL